MPLDSKMKIRQVKAGGHLIQIATRNGKVVEAKLVQRAPGSTKRRSPPDDSVDKNKQDMI